MLNRTLSRILAALILIVGGLSLVPAVSAVCTGGLLGNICVGETSVPTSAGGTFHAQWSFPGAVDTATQVFTVTVEIDTSASAQTLNLPAASAWTYNGCSFTSETTSSVTGVVASSIARITMTSQYCVISLLAQSKNAASTVTSAIPILIQVESQSIPVAVGISGGSAGATSTMHCQPAFQVEPAPTKYDRSGFVQVCLDYPDRAPTGGQVMLSASVNQPPIGTAATVNPPANLVGCSSAALGVIGSGGNTASNTHQVPYRLTMTGPVCSGTVQILQGPVGGGAAIWTFYLPFTIATPTLDAQSRLCAASSLGASCSAPTVNNAVTGSLDTQARFCAASALGASCTAPTVNNAVTGTMTVTNAGGQTVTVSGNLDTLQRFCAASAVGTTCSTPTVNNAVTGTMTVTNAGGQTVTVSGNLDTLQRFCAASAIGTTCSTPTVNNVLSGEVHPCSTAALTADPNACHLDTTASNVNVGNNTNNVSIPSTFHLCGEELTPGDCEPIQQAGTLGFTNSTTDHFIPIFIWLGALIFFLRLGKLVAAAASSAGFIGSILTNDNSLQIVALTILGIALWLEATAKEKIYARWAEERDT